MRPLSINFAPPARRLVDRVGILLLAAALATAAGLGWHRFELGEQLAALDNELGRHTRAGQPSRAALASTADADRQRAELRFARRVIEQLDTPWNGLFAAIESTYDDNVTLLGVEPEPERREVRLLAESKDTRAMLAYVRQVRESPVLREAWLANHQVNLQDPLRPVRFSINARWIAPPEKAPEPDESPEVTDETAKATEPESAADTSATAKGTP